MQKWEYETATFHRGVNSSRSEKEKTLTKLGEEGWEFTAIDAKEDGSAEMYIFKRPKQ